MNRNYQHAKNYIYRLFILYLGHEFPAQDLDTLSPIFTPIRVCFIIFMVLPRDFTLRKVCMNILCLHVKNIVFRYTFFVYNQPVYKQLGLDFRKVKQLLGLKHVTISNFANKIFAYENIATTLHNHIHS